MLNCGEKLAARGSLCSSRLPSRHRLHTAFLASLLAGFLPLPLSRWQSAGRARRVPLHQVQRVIESYQLFYLQSTSDTSVEIPMAKERRREAYNKQAGSLFLVLVAKSTSPSSSLFHKACKVRERGGVRSTTLQPVMQSTHIHGNCGDDMLKMGARLSNVPRSP